MVDVFIIIIGCTIVLGIVLYLLLYFAFAYLVISTIAEILKTFSGGRKSDR